MRILLTGYPGFLAEEILQYFLRKGATVDTLGLLEYPAAAPGHGKHLVCNLAEQVPVLDEHYDMVIHAAGKAHVVPRTKEEAEAFFKVNLTGTAYLLEALKPVPPRSIVFISSVAVYGAETGDHISETAPLAATDPYGQSKIEAEKLICEFDFQQEVTRGIVRLPLIAGSGAPGNLGSMFRAMKKGFFFNVGKGEACRSVILRSDVPVALELVAARGGTYNITDCRDISFAELTQGIRKLVPCPRRPDLPRWFAFCLALAGEIMQKILRRSMPFNMKRYHQMTESLTFDGTAARQDLGFAPRAVLDNLQELIK